MCERVWTEQILSVLPGETGMLGGIQIPPGQEYYRVYQETTSDYFSKLPSVVVLSILVHCVFTGIAILH